MSAHPRCKDDDKVQAFVALPPGTCLKAAEHDVELVKPGVHLTLEWTLMENTEQASGKEQYIQLKCENLLYNHIVNMMQGKNQQRKLWVWQSVRTAGLNQNSYLKVSSSSLMGIHADVKQFLVVSIFLSPFNTVSMRWAVLLPYAAYDCVFFSLWNNIKCLWCVVPHLTVDRNLFSSSKGLFSLPLQRQRCSKGCPQS